MNASLLEVADVAALFHPLNEREYLWISRLKRPSKTVAERLEMYSIPEPNSGCTLFLGVLDKDGYPFIVFAGKRVRAHRIAYEVGVGPIPEGLTIDHLCKVRACINVAHLEPVTAVINAMRGNSVPAQRARMTACQHGHPFDEANTLVNKKGHRICRHCCRDKERRRRAAKRESRS